MCSPYEKYLPRPSDGLDERVALILEAVRYSVERQHGEDVNEANVRLLEAFFSFLEERFPAGRFQTEIQPIPKKRIRTTDRNFVVTVKGRSSKRIVLVAHYDTWAGLSREAPGADDNTTGEEVLKHYLLRDLSTEEPPELTHVYLFAGSEECGMRGLISQLGLTMGLVVVGFALSMGNPLSLLLALPFIPLACYRFGVTGTRHFVDSLSEEVKSSIRAAIAVDSVGEGRLYILENEMGANFIRALFPYEGSEKLNDLLEEGAHLNHIKYNRFLAGGTTDSVAFLEERRVLPGDKQKGHIPAAAIIAMSPGKCSPFVLGGKLHTRHDTADRIDEKPLREVLTILDYAFDILQGGERPRKPRELTEHHYARLYRVGEELFVAMKDAIEPNRRNINSIFRVRGEMEASAATLRVQDTVWWGVETSLDKEMRDYRPGARRVAVDTLVVEDGDQKVRFESPSGWGRKIEAWANAFLGALERWTGRNSFVAMFGTALLVAFVPTHLLEWGVGRFSWLAGIVVDYYLIVIVSFLALQLLVLFRLFTRELPTWMDNAYRHRNRADNLQSLRRSIYSSPPAQDS
jgi:hypothetical protein